MESRRAVADTACTMSVRLPEDVRTFIRERLTSMDDVDVVVLLLKHPAHSWTAAEVAVALASSPEVAGARLFLLAANGLVSCEPGEPPRYRYVVSDDEPDRLLRELADLCEHDRGAVVETLEPRSKTLMRRVADVLRLTR